MVNDDPAPPAPEAQPKPGEDEREQPTRWRDRLLGSADCIHGVRLYLDCVQCSTAPGGEQ